MKKSIVAGIAVLMACCGSPKQNADMPALPEAPAFDTVINGNPVALYTLKNDSGMVVQLTNYGSTIVSVVVPAADGSFKDVATGFESIAEYASAMNDNRGPVVGRYGNRIAKGKFTLDGTEYNLPINDGENTLHSGPQGFAKQVWKATQLSGQSVRMEYESPDGENGFPGNLSISVLYTLTLDNKLKLEYRAITDAPTVLNPTSHPYFNLHGTTTESAMTHVMTIYADNYTPTDAGLIPTGEIAPLDGTPLDFRTPTVIGERIDADFEAIAFGRGYDHNWVLNKPLGDDSAELAAEVYEPATGIVLKVWTDQPGMQFYSGNFMKNENPGKRGDRDPYRSAIALETQNFPDAPNHENFPSSVLRPGEVYTQTCIYGFEVKQ